MNVLGLLRGWWDGRESPMPVLEVIATEREGAGELRREARV
jgi:hypothetical protein